MGWVKLPHDRYYIMSSDNNKSNILAALESNLPATTLSATPPARLIPAPNNDRLVSDTEEDYKYSREKLKSLIDKAEDSLDRLIVVADEAEHPRAFEVLAGMLKTTSEMTGQLLDLQKRRKELIQNKEQRESQAAATNVAVFVGTTADLQQKLAADLNTTIIDAKSN